MRRESRWAGSSPPLGSGTRHWYDEHFPLPCAGLLNHPHNPHLPPRKPANTNTQILDGKNRPLSLQSLDFVLSINLRGTIDLVRQFLPQLSQSPPSVTPSGDKEHGVVVMVSSAAAFDGQMGQVSYAASKGAVASMTLPMTRDLSRHGIRVVTIAPGTFETPMTSVLSDKVRVSLEKAMEFPKRGGTAAEFAALTRHVIENVMLNGCVIRLDGGARMPSRL